MLVEVADLPEVTPAMEQEAPRHARMLNAAASWGPRYVRFRDRAGWPAWTDEAYAAWDVLGDLIQDLRTLAGASERKVVRFYRRYGPLGYGDLLRAHQGDPPDWRRLQGERPDWVRLRGEPLGWVRWQARKLDAFGRFEHAYKYEQVDDLRHIVSEGVQADGAVWLPDRNADAIRVPWDLWGPEPGGPPRQSAEFMRAARLAIQWTLRQAMAGARIVPGEDWHPIRARRRIEIRGTWEWEIPTLLAAVYLSYFLAHTNNAVGSCEVCATPFFVRGAGYPMTCSSRCTATLRQRRYRHSLRGEWQDEEATGTR
jgi:hypothetical protein